LPCQYIISEVCQYDLTAKATVSGCLRE